MKDYYATLGVPENATADEISKAYRNLAKRYHPDLQGDATEAEKEECARRFRDVTEAYGVLSSPRKREKYDRERQGDTDPPDWGDDDVGGGALPPYLDISEEPTAITAILTALAAGQVPDLYCRAGCLALVETSVSDTTGAERVQIVNVIPHRLRALLHSRVPTIKFSKKGEPSLALPGVGTCLTILQRREWPGMPVLRGVAHAPVLREDGGLIQEPGYDRQTGLYLHLTTRIKPVPGTPTRADIAAAKGLLLDLLLADFSWAGGSDRANYLAALFTPVLRPLTGLSPFFVVTAPERGSGKTLLSADIPKAVHGASVQAYPAENAEMKKVITSVLRGDNTQPVVVFDNVAATAKVDSAALATVLTAPEWSDRILGSSKVVEYPNDRLWICNGTNVRLGGDIPPRSVVVELNYARPRPDLRTGFAVQFATAAERLGKLPEDVTDSEAEQYGQHLDEWLAGHQGDVLHALLVLARAWVVAGMPKSDHAFRGGVFTRWAQVCGGLLDFHEIPGFLASRDQVTDTDADIWSPFLALWRKVFPRPAKVRDLLESDRLEEVMPIIRDAQPADDANPWADAEPTQSELSKLGMELKVRRGRWFPDPDTPGGYLTPQCKKDSHSKANVWWVETHKPERNAPRSPRSPRKEPRSPGGRAIEP